MTIALRGAAVVPTGGQANPTTGYTITIPSAVVADDLLFLTLTSRDSVGAGTIAVTDNDSGGNTYSKIGNSTDHKITLWYKRATSATASKTLTVANCVGSCSGVLKCFSGCDTGGTPYADVLFEAKASGTESQATFTPSQANSMVCCAVANYANDNAVTSLSFATLGATTATECLSTGGSDCGNIFGHKIQTGAAAVTGTLTWAQTDGTTYVGHWTIKPLSHPSTGALTGPGAVVVGSATRFRAHPATGVVGGLTATISGAAVWNAKHATSGVLVGLTTVVVGSAARTRAHATTGALTGASSVIDGSAAHIAIHPTTGVLVGESAVVGAAARTRVHATTGALVGSGATIVGSAVWNAKHATSGVLAGEAAVVGSAARTRAHPTSGTIVGAGAAVNGAAVWNAKHSTSSILVGQSSTVVGSAARTRFHAASGVLTGSSSTLSGTAARIRIHAASGALSAAGALLVGSAARSRIHTNTGALTGSGRAIVGTAARSGGAPVTHSCSGVLAGHASVVGSATRQLAVTDRQYSNWILRNV